MTDFLEQLLQWLDEQAIACNNIKQPKTNIRVLFDYYDETYKKGQRAAFLEVIAYIKTEGKLK